MSFYSNLLKNFNLADDKFLYFKKLSNLEKSYILEEISNKTKIEILNKLSDDEILEIFKFLDPDEIVDIIQLMKKKRQKKLISKLNKSFKEKVNFLMQFAPDSAAGIMSLNYIIITNQTSKTEIIQRIKKHIEKGRKEPTILVIDKNGSFLGELRISSLLLHSSSDLFKNLKKLPTVFYNDDQEDVINLFKKNKHEKIVVLAEDSTILGIIHARDIFRAIEAENTEDFYAISGLDKEEEITDSPFDKVKFRLSWLFINLLTAFLATWVVSSFENTISKFVLLAAFMPIVAGMGGNAATQSTALMIRSIALNKVYKDNVRRAFLSEILGAFINGVIIGLIVWAIIYVFYHNSLFGFLTALAIITNMIVAAIFGTLIPIILNSFGIDPAASSTVFVTTATDVLGFFVFLGLASLFLV